MNLREWAASQMMKRPRAAAPNEHMAIEGAALARVGNIKPRQARDTT